MLAEARPGLPPERALPGGLAFEQKPDGYRAVLFAGPGRAYLQSRNGADLSSAFCEITAAGRALHAPLVLDGELVVATKGRLDFGELQARARRRGAAARQAARAAPANLIVFGVLDTADGPLLNEPYARPMRPTKGRYGRVCANSQQSWMLGLTPTDSEAACRRGYCASLFVRPHRASDGALVRE
ncbi:hypothetical protein [Streptomyces sp. NRRL WC-3725]|uniref:ATP-dependent DNA ligase n=1 Tax=Streptomyces sp. NRRL WC-3725 TaxID=1463933 RepID=UPI00068A227E|nr:hypothetical protein [Streptomyces sp. NRRL WC-3725]